MQSGFGGGVPEFYSTAGGFSGRSMNGSNSNSAPMQFRAQPQLQGIFLDPNTQIPQRAAPSLFGKRTLSEFQAFNQQHQQNPVMPAQFLRSVKQRTLNNRSPMSPLSPLDASLSPNAATSSLLQQRFGLPLLNQHLRPQQIPLPNGAALRNTCNIQNRAIPPQDSQRKMLQELEKQLLDDIDEESDAVSVITNTNSEWSEAIQNLITPIANTNCNVNGNAISPSPTSSTSSSSTASPSVASPSPNCSKQLLLDAATAISDGKTDVALEILTRVSTQVRSSPENRLLECLTSAVKARVNPDENPPATSDLYGKEHAVSTQLLYDHSPCFKLAFRAANIAILETAIGEEQSGSSKIHVVDFDIGNGSQYTFFLNALSAKQNGKPSVVKITTVPDNGGEERLKAVGEALKKVAQKVGICLKFSVVSLRIGELSRESLGCEADELLAINFAFKLYRMPDESVSTENPRDALLRSVKALSPKVVTLVEQEMNANTAPFMARVKEVCAYYGALFDSIESTVARDHPDRARIEEGLSRRLVNTVACEGRERVERCEVLGKWRARMSMAGFESKPLGQKVTESLRLTLGASTGFTIKEENGGVCFGWKGRNLTVASAWR